MRILGIETSCDETGVAVYDAQQGLLANLLHSQTDLHNVHGGVVPEWASRHHLQYIYPLTHQALTQTNTTHHNLNAIAYTAGPGLQGSLLVGASFAKSLALAWRLPTIAIHHLEAHYMICMLEEPSLNFPFLVLLTSGGHTQLVIVEGLGRATVLGQSIDDAAGEAFDKTARLLGLSYPGGPALEQLAQQGDPRRFKLPRPMAQHPDFNFSFSGLKTAVQRIWQQFPEQHQHAAFKADLASSTQQAIVDSLIIKCERALEHTQLKQLVLAGGVGANKKLRTALTALTQRYQAQLYHPSTSLCTDNGAMIAYLGYLYFKNKNQTLNFSIEVYPRWDLNYNHKQNKKHG